MKKGIIFDMDGTIVDSLPYHHDAWRIFFEENKVDDFSEKLKKYKGGGTLDLMKAIYGDIYSIDELKKMSDDKEVIFRKIYKGNIKPIKGFLEFIFYLKSKISSNTQTPLPVLLLVILELFTKTSVMILMIYSLPLSVRKTNHQMSGPRQYTVYNLRQARTIRIRSQNCARKSCLRSQRCLTTVIARQWGLTPFLLIQQILI